MISRLICPRTWEVELEVTSVALLRLSDVWLSARFRVCGSVVVVFQSNSDSMGVVNPPP
jgi:hypothetical protein